MRKINILFSGLAVLCGLFLIKIGLLNAQTFDNPLSSDKFGDLVDAIIRFITIFGMALVPLVFIVGGIYFITGGGDPKRVETGKKIMLYATLGMLIILGARALIAIVKYLTGG